MRSLIWYEKITDSSMVKHQRKNTQQHTTRTCTWAGRPRRCNTFLRSCIGMQEAWRPRPRWLQVWATDVTTWSQTQHHNITALTMTHGNNMMILWDVTTVLPASHSFLLNCRRVEPCGQAQVNPPGRRRHRWLHVSWHGFRTAQNKVREMEREGVSTKIIENI